MLKRFFSALLALALVISLCPQTAFAASTPNQPLVISGQTDVHTNPLYPDVVPDTVPDTGRNTAPTLNAGTSESHYGTLEEVAADIRGYMKSRTETFTVYWNYKASTTDQNAMQDEVTAYIHQALEMAMEHTGNPTEGDYIRWMWGQWNVSWSASGTSYTNLNVALTFTLTYYTTAQQEQQMDQAVKSLLQELNLNGKSDYQKIQAIYDYITHNVVYDDANVNNKNYTLQYTAYAALINGTSVCQGYATLFYRLALELGIDARLIAGTSSRQSHAWNIVELDNLYYNLDSTWDAEVAAIGYDYQYFLKSNADFPDHTPSEEYTTTAFIQAYPMATSSYTPGTNPPQHTHSYTSTVTQPTCTQKGYTTYTCSCGDTYTGNEVAAKGHTEVTDAAKAATCTATGLTEGKHCSVCNTVTVAQQTVPAKGHTEVADAAKAATCTEYGLTEGKHCSVCNTVTVEQKTVAAKGHSYSNGTCSVCGAKDPDYMAPTEPQPTEHTHNYTSKVTQPTCTAKGYTTYTCSCGDTYTGNEVAAKGHTEVTDAAKAATCTATGLTEGKHCSVCNTVTVAQQTVPAKGHSFSGGTCSVCGEKDPNYVAPTDPKPTEPSDHEHIGELRNYQDPTCTEQGYSGDLYCTICGIMLEQGQKNGPLGHSYAHWVVEEYPTETTSGLKSRTCTVCGYRNPGGLTLREESHPDGFPVSITNNQYGFYNISILQAVEGHQVFVSLHPDSGCYVAAVYYGTDGTYCAEPVLYDDILCFTMPDGTLYIEIVFAPIESPFVDVTYEDYFYLPVLWALENNITSGVDYNQFGSNNACTRAQVVTFLWAAAGKPEPETTVNPFRDVKESDYFYKAVLWAVENGITSGMDANTFGSNNPCTRAQVVTFLWAALGRPEPTVTDNPFTDVKETDYYYKAVLFAVEYGITSGMSATTFGSGNTCTRAHVVTFLYKTFHG